MRAYKREEDRKRKIKRCTDGTDIRVQFRPDLSQVFSPSSSFCYIAYATSSRRCFPKIYMQIFLFALSSIVSRAFKSYRGTLSPSLKPILIFPYSYRTKVHVFFLTFLKLFFLKKGERERERGREKESKKKKQSFVQISEKGSEGAQYHENHIGIRRGPRTRDTCDFELEKVNTRSARWRGMSLLYRCADSTRAGKYVYFSCNI